jgi:hypothetical protein
VYLRMPHVFSSFTGKSELLPEEATVATQQPHPGMQQLKSVRGRREREARERREEVRER